MIDKKVDSLEQAVADINDGAVVMTGGFGEAGLPTELTHALIDHGARDLTVVANNAGNGHVGLAALFAAGRVRKLICSFPRTPNHEVFAELYRAGRVEMETVPQGTLVERMRAAGAGIGPFYSPTSVGTPLAEGKEVRHFNGQDYVLEHPLAADFALVKAETADRWGNLTYRMTARNFGPVMCIAAETTVVQVRRVVDVGGIDPECVVTPGIFVDRVVEVANPMREREASDKGEHYP